MKVSYDTRTYYHVKDLKAGTIFDWGGKLYLLTYGDDEDYYAVSMEEYTIEYFDGTESVIPYFGSELIIR